MCYFCGLLWLRWNRGQKRDMMVIFRIGVVSVIFGLIAVAGENVVDGIANGE